MKHYVWFVFYVLFSSIAAAKEVLPEGCKAMPVKGDVALLRASKPTLVMIHNISDTELWVTHPVSEPTASAGFSSRLEVDHWSALMLQDSSFELSCIESKPGHEQQVACTHVIAVCQWPEVKTSEERTNQTYWAGENMTLSALNAYLGRSGFELPESNQR